MGKYLRFRQFGANHLSLAGLTCLAVMVSSASAKELSQSQINFFERKIRPIFAKNCYECHSAKSGKTKGGLRVDTRDGLLKGGESGAAIVPKDLNASLLYQAVRQTGELKMPPKKTLSSADLTNLAKWIRMDAPDPREDKAALVKADSKDASSEKYTPSIDIEKGRQFWAFKLPKKAPPPTPKNATWPRTEIDRFVMTGLEQHGLKPNPDADKVALLRRVYFDLIGLPPTPEQVSAFVNDKSAGAFEKIVNQLLDSPRYGERWGRHWLDVARYAESNGMERNQLFPHAWRYRDYVIESFNADKPFDRFIKEQIAGDLLEAKDSAEKDRNAIATGFLAMGPKSLNERDQRVFRMDVVDEQIDIATRSTMAITVSCARCHDHKFDPISTADYYGIAGIFRSSQTRFNAGASQGVRQKSGLIALSKQASESVGVTYAKQTEADPKGKKAKKNKKNAAPKKATGPQAMGIVEGKPENCAIHMRGDVATLGPVIPRGFPAVMRNEHTPSVNAEQSGRRELADWIASPHNPLTARVFANRAWNHLLGRGIVRTVDNFGESGERPTNPALLDHLAIQFAENGWSVKSLVRTIVLSRTYQLATTPHAANNEVDPENKYFWKMNHRRLDAESIRDAMLQIAGRINLTPPPGSVIAPFGEAQIDRNVKQLNEVRSERDWRAVYLPVVRNNVSDMMTTFDFAEPSMIVGNRSVTTVPSQALFLLNGEFVLKQSESLARRLLNDSSLTSEERIDHAYQLTLNRKAATHEKERILSFVQACQDKQQPEAETWSGVCQALFASGEFRYLN